MTSPNLRSPYAIAFLVFLLLAMILNLALVSGFALTLFLGWMIAEIMRPLHERWTEKKKGKRAWGPGLSAFLVTMVATLAIILPSFSIIALTVHKVNLVAEQRFADGVSTDELAEKVWNFEPSQRFFDSPEELNGWMKRQGGEIAKKTPAMLSRLAAGLPGLVLQLTLALITCFFILVDGRKFSAWIGPRIPIEQKFRAHLSQALKDTTVSSALATFAAALAQASVIVIGFLILGIPAPELAFGLGFIFAWFPLVGVGPVWIAAVIYLLSTGSPAKAIVMVGFGIVASLIDNVVRAWMLKGKSDIHPLISLIVIFGNIEFFGILGVFTGPVLAKLLIELLHHWPELAPALGIQVDAQSRPKPTD